MSVRDDIIQKKENEAEICRNSLERCFYNIKDLFRSADMVIKIEWKTARPIGLAGGNFPDFVYNRY